MQVRTVCLLGGTGFVGRHLAARLAAEGVRVKVLTRRRESARPLWLLPGLETVEADIFDTGALARTFRGADAVVNLVGILHERRKGDFQRVHAELPLTVARTCLAEGVPRLLHMSALAADEHGPSYYLRTKGKGEASVLDAAHHGLKVTVFRPSVIFGPEDRFLNLFARLARLAPVLPLAQADARFQPVYVGDVVHAFAASLADPATFGHRYDLCGPRVYTLGELVAYAARLGGACPVIWPLPRRLAYWQAWAMEHLPGSLMTRDNLRSMEVDSVCACPYPAVFGGRATPLEAVAPTYLGRR